MASQAQTAVDGKSVAATQALAAVDGKAGVDTGTAWSLLEACLAL